MNIFCSYHFIKKPNNGFGNIILQTDEKFPLSLREIRRFEKEIKEAGHFNYVVVLNFTELGGE